MEPIASIVKSGKDPAPLDINPSAHFDDELDSFGGRMSGTGASSPLIKDEPEDWFGSNPVMLGQQAFSMPAQPQRFNQQVHGSIDPSELAVQNSSFGQFNYGGNQNSMSSSFHMAGSGIGDDELFDLDLNDNSKMHGQMLQQAHGSEDMHGVFNDNVQQNPGQMNQIFTNTPNGEPIQSPFLQGNFNYNNYQHQMSQHMSPHTRPITNTGQSMPQDYNYGGTHPRARMSHVMDRKPSDSRSPMTPKTPALGGLNLAGTPDSGSLPSQPLSALSHRHQKSLSGQWDSTPASLHSFADSPMTSPTGGLNHAQLSDVIKSGKHASLPSKVDAHHTAPAYQSQEAKRRRRRESHNMVERRRRDNINERIQELSHLVPHHRLEDEKVRKHLATNGPGPLSPTLAAASVGPQPATSLLANGGRRATGAGNITMGIPIEEKDKGPNKGDILNGSVGWTRDLMWALYGKFQQEAELKDIISRLGGNWPFDESEDEKRMRTELMDAMEKNDAATFGYSRANGTGLRVPKHTTLAGEPLGSMGQSNMGTLSPQSLSPGIQPGGSGNNSGHNQPQFWTNNSSGRGSLSFKEEDEYDMQMS